MTVYEILTKLTKQGIKLQVVDNSLNVKAKRGTLTADVQQLIRDNKDDLIHLIDSLNNKTGIPKVDTKPYYQLSSAQRRMYLLYEFDKSSLAYNLPQVVRLEGKLDKSKLVEAFKQLIARHEILRTNFEVVKDLPVQKVSDHIDFDLEYLVSNEEEVPSHVKKFIRPFDVNRGPLMRAGLITIDADEGIDSENHILMVDLHHIITDGVSQGILVKDFMTFYHGKTLPPVRLQYKDYAEWQQGTTHQNSLRYQKSFWLNQFSEPTSTLSLPTDFQRPAINEHLGDSVGFYIDATETHQLQSLAEKANVTMYMVLLSVFNILLAKLCNQEDIVLGSPIAGRRHADLDGMMGMFVNTLALRNYPKGELRFREFLNDVQARTLACFDNQDYQYEELIDELKVERDTGRNPLFDVLFSHQNFEQYNLEMSGLVLSGYDNGLAMSKFDLTLVATEWPDRIGLSFSYSTQLFTKTTIHRFAEYFKKIVSSISSNPEIKIWEINVLSETEEQQLLGDFNNTIVNYPRDDTLTQLFDRQVQKTPSNIALAHNNVKITYHELKERADQLAGYLSGEGVKEGSIVGLLLDRSMEMIIGIMGILKAGGTYLPLDPDYPEIRVKEMLSDANALHLLTEGEHLRKYGESISIIDAHAKEIYAKDKTYSNGAVSSKSAAYIIYTSGSTGKPKGVIISHRSVVNLIYAQTESGGLTANHKILQFSNICFDVSVDQIWTALLNGAELVMVGRDIIADSEKFNKYIIDHKVTHLDATPSFLETVELTGENSLITVVSGGEECKVHLARRYCKDYKFYNKFGPTESTVTCIESLITEEELTKDRIPIGKPINNTYAYILGSHLELMPVGSEGELVIGGEGLSLGYLNNATLTDERFVANPFRPGERMYRTGDLARWLPDGNLEYLGRLDEQVKIRGFRIELGEIAYHLGAHPQVREEVVLVRKRDGDPYLVAYFVSESKIDVAALKAYLSKRLPDYMVPPYFVEMESMPLTISGKINKKLLPEPDQSSGSDYTAASNDIEHQLVTLWSEVLKLDEVKISVTTSFFELGGHSLRAMMLCNKIFKLLGVEVPLKEIFNNQDIRRLSDYISKTKKSNYQSIEPAAFKADYPLSSAQQRLYFLYEFDKNSLAYNMPQVVRLKGDVSKERLEKAFKGLIMRHESLRTSFLVKEEQTVQVVADSFDFEIEWFESSENKLSDRVNSFIRPFDLNTTPLIRVGLIAVSTEEGIGSQDHILMVDMHHIISDGVSQGILIRDFMSLYNDESLDELRIQYKDYSEWQQSEEQQNALATQREFWLNEFAEETVTLDIPTDFPRPLVKDHKGGSLSFILDSEQTTALQSIAKSEGTTMFMVILAIYNILLSKLSNQEDIVIGTPVAGRQHADLESMIGMFINTLPMRNYPIGTLNFKEFLSILQSKTLACFDHQGYQYEELIDELKISRDISRNPLFDVIFSYQNFEQSNLEMKGLVLSDYDSGHSMSKFDLTLTATEWPESIGLNFGYSTQLFTQASIQRFADYFKKIVSALLSNLEVNLWEINVLSEAEQQQLLLDFNNTTVDFPGDHTLTQLFDKQVEETPNNIALVHNHEKISYHELNVRTNQLAGYLRETGVEEGSIVGLLLERSMEMIIGIIGILKAGGTYLPLDPAYPEIRVKEMLSDANALNLLTEGEHLRNYTDFIPVTDVQKDEIYTRKEIYENGPVSSKSVAYVIYTSGSTGKPKGVVISHRSVINLIYAQTEKFAITENDRILQFSTICFDASVDQIWSALLNGAALVLVSKDIIADSNRFNNYIIDHEITHLNATPSFLETVDLIGQNKIKRVLSGGEECKVHLVEKFCEKYDFYNKFGPTESTVICIESLITEKEVASGRIPIGKPINNTYAYVLSPQLELMPLRSKGELYIGGEGLSEGYLNNAALTEERFIANPFRLGERMYRTGDQARWLPDGNLEYLGRLDEQVKIRGFRIELGEIEYHLGRHPQVKEVVVLAQQREGDPYLVAYYVSASEIEPEVLKNYLSDRLPDHMIPGFYIEMESMPLTINGKINKKLLPIPNQSLGSDYTAASNEIEHQLVTLWSQVLKLDEEQISVTTSFFELGGHSLRAMMLCNKIFKSLGVEVPLKEIFSHQDIKSLAQYISKKEKSVYESIQPASHKPYYSLSSAQKRMYFLYQFDKNSLAYNMPQVVRLVGVLDKDRLEDAFKQLIMRHESLRTAFKTVNDQTVQEIINNVDFEIECFDSSEGDIPHVIRSFIRPFGLDTAPLIRVGLIAVSLLSKASAEDHILMVDMHHIISDGVSQGVLIKDFMSFYNEEALDELRIQYKDYSEWQQSDTEQEVLAAQRKFWLNEFLEETVTLDLPTDFTRPRLKDYQGDSLGFNLESGETTALKSIAKSEGTTMFMVILAAYNILLSKLSNQEDIVIGTPVAGRQHADLESMIGMFINTLPLRNYPLGTLSFKEFLSILQSKTLECFDHQDYQYEELIDELQVPRDTGRNPLFDVVFSYQNFESSELEIPGLTLKPYSSEHAVSKFDLSLSVTESDDKIFLNFSYATALFEVERIEGFVRSLRKILSEIIDNVDIQLSSIEILSMQESNALLKSLDRTSVPFPENKTIIDLFRDQARRNPDHTAVQFESQTITYSELDQRTDQLAQILYGRGVRPDMVVGLFVDRSIDTIVGMLSILKSGGAYMPIDTEYPEERINYLIEDSGTKLLVSTRSLKEKLEDKNEIVYIDELESEDQMPFEVVNKPSDLCYIIYTSGTTGQPKGVMVEHRNVVRLFFNDAFQFDFGSTDVWTMFHSPSFDFSVWEIYGALLFGAKLIIVPKLVAQDTAQYLALLQAEGVTVLNQTPSAFYNLLHQHEVTNTLGLNLRYVIFGGEALSPAKIKWWKQTYPETTLVNMFGITETTVHVTYKEITNHEIENNISVIGKPIPTLSVYIFDKDQHLVPKGSIGELYVGGSGVTRGYLGKEALTRSKFVHNPYNSQEKLYRSGDLVRLLDDGELEYIGRADDQVKIRGFRIELGEIEHQLSRHNSISETRVLPIENDGEKYLACYYTADSAIEIKEFKNHLSEKLPEHMIPSYYVHLDSFPVTSNGKVNIKALPKPEVEFGADYVGPVGELEEQLTDIWAEVLKLDQKVISVTRSFFEMGGHSLRATMMVNKIFRVLSIKVPLKEVFVHQDIRSLANYLANAVHSDFESIEPAARQPYYSLSSAQRRMYFLYEFDTNSLAYNMPQVVRLEGNLDKNKLADAFRRLILRHESLRTSFVLVNEEPMQRITNQFDFDLEYFESNDDEVSEIVKGFITPFDLSKGPLIRVGLIVLSGGKTSSINDHILMVDMHHIVTDGVSQGVLVKDFMALYSEESLPAIRLHYKDYAQWQQSSANQKKLSEHREFWISEFSEEPISLTLPFDYPRPVVKSFEGDSVGFYIDSSETKQLRLLASESNATMYMVLLSAYNILLSKLSNQEDIVVGTPLAGRDHPDLENVMGMFVNTLALRQFPKGELSFRDFLSQVQSRTLNCFEHQSYQYEELIDDLKVQRDTGRNPLFDVIFSHQNFESSDLQIPGLVLSDYDSSLSVSKFDLSLIASESNDEIGLSFGYSTGLFKKETVNRFVLYFKKVISILLENPDIRLNQIDILSSEERNHLLNDFNNTSVDYPIDSCVVQLFEAQVAKTPNKQAVVFGDVTLDYKKLNERSNALARELKSQGVERNHLVAIISDKSPDMIVGLLAILKAGGAFLPIDPDYPAKRVRYILEDSQSKVLLCPKKYSTELEYDGICVDLQDPLSYSRDEENLESINLSTDRAYTIYTSGSSGNPKGVNVEHRALVNLCFWHIDHYGVSDEDRASKYAGFGFDASIWEIFPYLLKGASIHIIEEDIRYDLEKLNDYFESRNVTIGFLPTQVFEQFTKLNNQSLRVLMTGGDKLKSVGNPNYILVNNYGPTENSVVTTSYTIDKSYSSNSIPIGKPIANVEIFITDKYLNLQPQGVLGELCIGGRGLASGYLHKADLTSECFVSNPFRPGERMYKTGDLAKWLPDGNIEYLGRFDEQVKIRGFRIELGEIGFQMGTHPQVKEEVVLVQEQDGEPFLVAYYVSELEIEADTLKVHLSERVPDYMIPEYYVRVEYIPLTANGKIDKKLLPIPEHTIGTDYEAASGELEQQLVLLWSEVLKLEEEQISVTTSFFELGGHSLRAMVLCNKIFKSLGVEVPLKEVFNHQDIRSLALYISKTDKSIYKSIQPAPLKPFYQLSSAQQRMYFLYEFDKHSLAYNMPQVVRLQGVLDKDRLERAFRELIVRHESLRTSFQTIGEQTVQKITNLVDFEIECFDATEKSLPNKIRSFIRPFDLEISPLIRVGLIAVSTTDTTTIEDHVLMIDMHHIISDGVSQGILIRDFMSFYNNENLEELRIQYKDYAEWQESVREQEALIVHREFWLNEFLEETTILNLPTDFNRPLVKNYEGGSLSFTMNSMQTEGLRSLAQTENTTMFAVILAAFNILLSKLSNQEDIIIGTPVAGRQHADLENMIGMFINTLPIRNHPIGNMSFVQFLSAVQSKTLSCFDHQDYQYEELIEELNVSRDTSRNPLFDVLFSYQNFEHTELEIPGLALKPYSSEYAVSKFDLSLTVAESEDKLFLAFGYCTALFKEESISRFAEYFKKIVSLIVADPTLKLADIDVMTKVERHQILAEFNDTFASYSLEDTVIDLFEQQVIKTPENVALKYGNESMTYIQLKESSDKMAIYLQKTMQVKTGDIVGLMIEREEWMISSIFGIFKAGAVYLPIDPEYPETRINAILEGSGLKVLITKGKYISQGINQIEHVVDLEEQVPIIYAGKPDDLDTTINPNDLAYVIYTSGSTGEPKGVMVEHHALMNTIQSMDQKYPLKDGDNFLLKTPFSFDVSVAEIFGWFRNGGSLSILAPKVHGEPQEIIDAVEKYQSTHINFVPSMFAVFLESLTRKNIGKIGSLNYIFLAGEALPMDLVRKFNTLQTSISLENIYGPTEATVYSCSYSLQNLSTDETTIPIGKPLGNVKMYVQSRHNKLQPVGVPGELCIAGEGIARGYLNNREFTDERFVDNPFYEGTLMYKTGDLVRWLNDGNLEFLGRIDNQVKIRGFRIELGEIEYHLNNYDQIREVVVDVREIDGEKFLVAYYVAQDALVHAELRDFLGDKVPEYMVPTFYIFMDSMPLTISGKINKQLLPDPDRSASDDYEAAATKTEEELVAIWAEILKLDSEVVSVTRSFFEMGGHSLRATIMVNKIFKVLSIKVPLKEVFIHQDIRSLGGYLSQATESNYESIEPAAPKPLYAVSSTQRRMYFLYEFDKNSLAYNMPQIVRLHGDLDKNRLTKAFRDLIQRHESLRTNFVLFNEEPEQRITEQVEFDLEYFEASEDEVPGIVRSFITPFDLANGLLVRVGLITLSDAGIPSENNHVLMFDMHHIITDGVSQGIMVKDFMALYSNEDLPTIRLHYKDYAEWQQGSSQQDALTDHRAFWLNEFSEDPVTLSLPLDYPRPAIKSHEGDSFGFYINAEETKQLRSLATESGATMFIVLLSAFNILLSRLSNQEDIVVGTPLAGRDHPDLDNILGMFVNTIALRNYPKGNLRFRDFLSQVQSGTLNCFEHQSYQYEELIDELKVPRDTGRNPLFDVIFTHQNFEKSDLEMPGLVLSEYESGLSVSKFDLSLTANDLEDRIGLSFGYSTELFKKETIQRVASYFSKIISCLLQNPEVQISQIDVLPTKEREWLLDTVNKTAANYPTDKTITSLIEEQVSMAPNRIALVYKDQSLSYKMLNQKSNALARELIAQGVEMNDLVAIISDKSPDMIVGILGILKAGAAFLPIDPDYPTQRIKYILEDSQSKLLLSQTKYLAELKYEGISIDLKDPVVYNRNKGDLEITNLSTDHAYTIYTSGSTGYPKGVNVEHRALVNLCFWHNNYCDVSADDRAFRYAGIGFDASLIEVFPYLIKGASIHFIEEDIRYDLLKLNEYFESRKVTIGYLPTQLFEQFTHLDNHSLRVLITGGGALKPVGNPGYKMVNDYGPTESTVVTTCYTLDKETSSNSIPIGKPIANVEIFVVDKYLNLQPQGVSGELCIGGHGLAAGYLNNVDRTTESFIANPYRPGERMYKTGDLARWLPDGNLEFLGRLDEQVKIRGFRIELGEIEYHLGTHHLIKEVVVLAHEQDGDPYLVAYYISDEEISTVGLKSYLSAHLPDYMIPGSFLHLEQMPLTPNGKIDKAILPVPDLTVGSDYEPAANESELQLVTLWSEVLKLDKEQISVTRSFFELGGHSLKAMMLSNKIFMSMGVEVPLKEIFNHQEIRSLADYISKAEKSTFHSITPVASKPYYQLSSAQRRMYFLYQFDKTSLAYNMPQIVRIEGVLDKHKIEGVFDMLIQRHESLRTSFEIIDGEPVQKVSQQLNFNLQTGTSTEDGIVDEIKNFTQPFDLNSGPLIRVALISIISESDEKLKNHLLMIDMHHIITDGVSQGILVKDFMALYNNENLSPIELHYKDYAEWQQDEAHRESLNRQRSFWLEQFSEPTTSLFLPADFNRPKNRTYEGESISFSLDTVETTQLNQLVNETGTTIYIVLLAAYNILLSKLSNQEDVVVGTPVAGRQHADLDDVMGMFVNTLALRNYPKGEMKFREFLSEVQSRTLACFDHQSYQYEELIDDLQVVRDTSRNPLFDVLFSHQNFEQSALELPGLILSGYDNGHSVAKFDLALTAAESSDQIFLNLTYSKQLFKRTSVEKIGIYFKRIVLSLLENPDIELHKINVLSKEERIQLLEGFNNSSTVYPKEKTIIQLFEQQVVRTPDHLALIHGKHQFTYVELNERANQVAHYLLSKKVEPGAVIGIMLNRSPEMIIAIIGILKSGCVYLPIDIDQPDRRIEHMLKDSGARFVIAKNQDLSEKSIALPQIDLSVIVSMPIVNMNVTVTPSNPAYIIYTSGSTGIPKGVLVRNDSVVNLIYAQTKRFGINREDRISQFSSIAFDASVEQIWLALLNSATLVGMDKMDIVDVKKFNNYLVEKKITHFHATPSFLESIDLPESNYLKRVISGGEECRPSLARKFASEYKFYNEYGPTESTVTSVECEVTLEMLNGTKVPIGKPINNTYVYILDKHRELLPLGSVGEMFIGGDGVTNGYLNNESLTALHFVSNPFRKGEKMYRTGDLARWLSDGNLDYMGRQDSQVKIRGFRIELGEIEHHLMQYEQITEVIVVTTDELQDKYLVAYYVSEAKVETNSLKDYLSEKLPAYMIPSHFLTLDKIPLTSNGKVNKQQLPKPSDSSSESYASPTSQLEKQMVAIWSKVLKIAEESISVTHNFFEIGGHSLKAITLISSINNIFDIEVSLVDLFASPTIRGLTRRLENGEFGSKERTQEGLILLKRNEHSSENVFLVHDGSGDVQGYTALVALIQSHNCWGLRSPLLNKIAPEYLDLKQIATLYIDWIKSVQPHGPYFLGGWSFGGTVAFEMARQLEAKNEKVHTLFMIDSVFLTDSKPDIPAIDAFSLEKERKMLEDITPFALNDANGVSTPEQLWKYVVDTLNKSPQVEKNIEDMIPKEMLPMIPRTEGMEIEQMIVYMNTIRSLNNAAKQYRPQGKLDAALIYFKAELTEFEVTQLNTFFNQEPTVQVVPTDHFNIMQQPFVEQLAEKFNTGMGAVNKALTHEIN